MKKFTVLVTLAIFMLAKLPVFAQSYKTIADTAALNAEYVKLSTEIADLNTKLEKAKKDQANYSRKSGEATSDAQSTASNASNKAENSINGSVKQAKKAKREARRSVRDAKYARHAQGNLDDANNNVSKLTTDLEAKQKRLKQLDEMRTSIHGNQQ